MHGHAKYSEQRKAKNNQSGILIPVRDPKIKLLKDLQSKKAEYKSNLNP